MVAIGSVTACSPSQNDTSVSFSASDVAASAASAPVATAQTLISSDNKIKIVVNGQFQNELDQANRWVDAAETQSLTLLQHDDQDNVTLVVNSLGAAKLKADDYFKQLAQKLQNNQNITDLKIGIATDNRMNYRFTHGKDNLVLRENCVALMSGGQLYSVCAMSDDADDKTLAAALNNISVMN